jgi:hypothetical protein
LLLLKMQTMQDDAVVRMLGQEPNEFGFESRSFTNMKISIFRTEHRKVEFRKCFRILLQNART